MMHEGLLPSNLVVPQETFVQVFLYLRQHIEFFTRVIFALYELLVEFLCGQFKLRTEVSDPKLDVVCVSLAAQPGLIVVTSHTCEVVWYTDKPMKILRLNYHNVMELLSKLGVCFDVLAWLRSINVEAI